MNLKFWKKDDFSDFKLPPLQGAGSGADLGLPSSGFGEGAGLGTGSSAAGAGLDFSGGFQPGATPQSMGAGSNPFQPNGFTSAAAQHDDEHDGGGRSGNASGSLHGKDLEVIAAKLDAIKSQLDMLNLRISTLEQRLPAQNQSESGGPRKPWY